MRPMKTPTAASTTLLSTASPRPTGRVGRIAGCLALIACLLAGAGCENPERQAFSEAEQAVAYYLPQFLNLTNRSAAEVRLIGEGYSHPFWNIQGHHYLSASRQAVIGASSYTIQIYALNPMAVGRSSDASVVIANQPADTGLKSVGVLKFEFDNPQAGALRVYVAHANIRFEE